MAYFNQAKKAVMVAPIKAILAKYGLKGSLSVRNHSTVVLSIRSGKIDFLTNYKECQQVMTHGSHFDEFANERTSLQVNQYSYKKSFSGTAFHCLNELFTVLYDGNHDRSDIMSDYFDVGWYVDVNIGEWDSPYTC